MPMTDRVYTERHRAESFGAVAAEYDAARPSYPARLIDDLLAAEPADVLDVGCGTGKVGRLFVARGLPVLGVEIDPKMAAVARSHGLTVDVAGFETWDARDRPFDLIVSGQAWHWIDPAVGVPKAAALLRRGGLLALFWNRSELDGGARSALDGVYRDHAPALLTPHGADENPPYARDLDGSGLFEPVEERVYTWEQTYRRDEWLALIATHSDHVVLPDDQRAALLAGVGAVIDRMGGQVAAQYRTRAVLARVKPR